MEKHTGHFMIEQALKEKLILHAVEKGLSVSQAVCGILERASCLREEILVVPEDRGSRYRYIEHARELYVYLPVDVYRQIKLIHADSNFFSMAQLVRLILWWFFDCLESKRLDEAAKTSALRVKRIIDSRRKINVQQLLHQHHLLITYNNRYHPEIVLRL